ncbi:MAG: amino acid transporter substrate-binding protein [Firmicutes bacterium]|nr:amino acid transporter substrate-binding protein [Bacillota bacterium]
MKKMKKIAAVLMTAVMAAALFAGCSSEPKTTTVDDIKKAGVLKIGLADDFPPFEYRDDQNNLIGFDIDLSTKIAEKLGVKVEFVPTEFSGIILALNSDKFDMIVSGLSWTSEREKEIAFAGPYLQSGQAIIVRADSDIQTVADLQGKVIGAQLGSTGEEAAKKIEGTAEVRSYDKVTEELQDLLIGGRIDAVVTDKPVGGYYIAKSEAADQYKILEGLLTEEPMGMGLEKDETELTAEVQKIFDELVADGTMSELSQKWFGYDAYAK